MISYDLKIHKEIVRLLKNNEILLSEDLINVDDKKEIIFLSDVSEKMDNSKTCNRNSINYSIKMCGRKNGTSIEMKNLKNRVIEALTGGDYVYPERVYKIDGCILDSVFIEDVYLFKEIDSNGARGVSATHYYQCSININFRIRGI